MVDNLIASTDILCLIPMKDVHVAKKRLRVSFPTEKQPVISNIITKLFLNTIETVHKIFDFAVVSPSEDILDLALDKGASFIYQDLGIDLNDALTTAINYAHLTAKWKYVLVLTADLPYLSDQSFSTLQNSLIIDSFTIISAPEKSQTQGTSGLLIPLRFWPSLQLQFGVDSFHRFQKHFQVNNFTYCVVHNQIGFDLDTIEDLNEFKINSPLIFEKIASEGEINQLFN